MPKRKIPSPSDRQNKFLTVYPPEWAVKIVRRSCLLWNDAIACWAAVLADATRENESRFLPEEWDLLAKALAEWKLDPAEGNPGDALARLVDSSAWHGKLNRADFPARLRELDYIDAWAVHWCVRFHEKHPEIEQWWKLEARTNDATQS